MTNLDPIENRISKLRRDQEPRAEFIKGLRQKLSERARVLKSESKPKSSIFNFTSMTKINVYATVLAALVLAVVLGVFYTGKLPKSIVRDSNQIFSDTLVINEVGDKAFGTLAIATTENAQQSNAAQGLGAGAADTQMSTPSASPLTVRSEAGGGGGAGVAVDKMIAPPYYTNLKYVYTGDKFTVDEQESAVYKRIKGFGGVQSADGILRNLNFGAIDLSGFPNQIVQGINLAQDVDFGYAFYINFEEGTVSVMENWKKWQTPDRLCQTEECFEQYRLQVQDIPDDETLISLANQFMSEHNISLVNYGSPYVQDYWRHDYEIAQDKSIVYLPDIVQVVYPLKINGAEVYDEAGNKSGLMVSVNVRLNKVSGVFELSSLRFDSSQYETVTDVEKLIGIAENGGFRPGYYYAESPETQTIELGTPITAYVKVWQFKPENFEGQELIVPALIFPITNAVNTPYFYQKNVIVPLVKDVLDTSLPGPVPFPLPAVKEGAQ